MATIRETLEELVTDETIEKIVHWNTHAIQFSQTFTNTFTSWQEVEKELFLIFNLLIPTKDVNLLSAAFHAVMSLDARIAMIHGVIKVKMQDDIYKPLRAEWNKLADKVRGEGKKRNHMAHFSLHVHRDKDGKDWYRIRPSIFDSRPSEKDYGIKELEKFAEDFFVLVKSLRDFHDKIAKQVPR